ncbi:hypothetical protein FSP39_020343 [Pinctada imbricata]|uniref:Uncharacterized protein n=1 Tax=Pinctada imbricata TaxID=66713 RepID=A0AA88YXG1_PINIB|nr:hypothetical protein FSP39_020343 [Pinctada imbricata]
MGCLLLQCSSLAVFAIVVNILKPTLAVKSKLICEHTKETLSCPDGEKIAIIYANYGRKDSEPCPHSQRSDTNCVSANSLRILREDCQGKRSCQLEATNAKFGDPCVGTFKYLELRYECKKACAPSAEMTFNGGCRCKLGYFGDPYQEGCAKMCMCKARGDPHYETYDGKMIHFQGNCRYVMTRSTHPDCRLEVAVKNNHRSSRPVTITREVDFTYNGITLRLLPQRKLKVDGIETDPCNYVSSDGSISISCCGNVLRVVTNPCGSIVEWDGMHAVHVMIPKIYAEGDYFSGICGNCNGDPTDDMVTQFGRNVEGEENAYYKLGSSWQIEDTSDIKDQEVYDIYNLICTDEIIPLPPCARKTVLAAAATEKCGMTNPEVDGPFKECLNEANIKSKEYDDCVFDYCLFSEEKPELMQQSICNMHNDLRQMCNDMGYNITWRDRKCPTECGENQQWFNVLSGCQPTCRRPNPKRCKLPPSSGCGCKPGYVLGALGKCVDAETGCGCTDGDGKYYPINGNAISLPKKLDGNGNIVPGDFDDWRFYVFKAGKTHVKVVAKCGYTLFWDGKSSAVFMVSARFAPKMEGLCGDCNKKQDDFRTKEGVDVSKRGKRKHALVGDSYQVPDDSDAAHTCTKYTPDPKDCTASQLKMARSDEFCGPFTFSNGSEAFWECLVDIGMEREELYKSCIIDVCNNADDMKAAKQVACSALTNAIELCAELSDQVTIQLAKFCGVNSEETTCRNDQIMTFDTSCPSTCLSEDDESLEACTPMLECQCKDGMFEENGKCVPKCGQFVDGVYVPVGGSYMSDDCSRMHSVNNNGQLVSKQLQCDVTYKKCRNRNCIIVEKYLASDFNFTCKYIDDVLSINNPKFADYLGRIYPSELEVKETTEANNPASYLIIMLSCDTDGHMNTSLYDKRDDFSFSTKNLF